MVSLATDYLRPDAPLVDAVRAIEASHRRIAVVADSDRHLLGTLTDGDVRRCLLSGGDLQLPVSKAMNGDPLTAPAGTPNGRLLELMRRRNVLAVPLIDGERRFDRVVHLTDLGPAGDALASSGFDFAVIMAGGEGARLRPLTHTIPKPMVEVGGAPLLERQIQRLLEAGVRKVYVSVNYLAHIIEAHFGDGSAFGIEIRYLREQEKLGTAGALSLLPERPTGPIVVMNGDVVTTSDFGSLFAFHEGHQAWVTASAVDYRVNIPYGVISAAGHNVVELLEKPSQRFLCNAGIYAISPPALDLLPSGSFYNMTDLINTCLGASRPVAVFPMHEYWNDIGTPDDLERARAFFSESGKAK